MEKKHASIVLIGISLVLLVAGCSLGPEPGARVSLVLPASREIHVEGYEWEILLQGTGGTFTKTVKQGSFAQVPIALVEFQNIPLGEYKVTAIRSVYDSEFQPELGPVEKLYGTSSVTLQSGENQVSVAMGSQGETYYRVLFYPDSTSGGTGDPFGAYFQNNRLAVLPSRPKGFNNTNLPIFLGWSVSPSSGFWSGSMFMGSLNKVYGYSNEITYDGSFTSYYAAWSS